MGQGNISYHDHWLEFEQRFRKLHESYPQAQAQWSGLRQQWQVVGLPRGREPALRDLFGLAAALAGPTPSIRPTDSWLNRVSDYLRACRSRDISSGQEVEVTQPPGTPRPGRGKPWPDTEIRREKTYTIRRLLQASADYCLRCAAESRSGSASVPSARQEARKPTRAERPRDRQPLLDVNRINHWMKEEGYDAPELASKLRASTRSISSLRNNGRYHGSGLIAKLANLMGVEPLDLYLS